MKTRWRVCSGLSAAGGGLATGNTLPEPAQRRPQTTTRGFTSERAARDTTSLLLIGVDLRAALDDPKHDCTVERVDAHGAAPEFQTTLVTQKLPGTAMSSEGSET